MTRGPKKDLINTIVAVCLQDIPHAPISSESTVVLPVLGQFYTEGLILKLQVSPAGICTDNLLTLPGLNVSTWLNIQMHKVLSVNTAQCIQACM